MKNKLFLQKFYKPWSFLWILQRFILVVKEGRLWQISLKTLLVDYKFSRAVNIKIYGKRSAQRVHYGKSQELSDYFNPVNEFEYADIVTCQECPEEELSLVNSYFDHVYVVNLEKRADKRLEMIQKLNKCRIKAEFFRAEDGYSDTNVREFKEYYESPVDPENAHELEVRLKRKVIYSPGAWGTLKTYKRLFEDASKRGYRRILCLQDDAVFHKDFEELFIATLQTIPESWKLLYLGASQHSWNQGIDLEYTNEYAAEDQPVSSYHPLNTDGAFAIGVDSSIFKFLISEIEKMNCSFDSGALRKATQTYRGECFVIKPNLIIADVTDSDIRIARKQQDFAETVRWELDQYDYPFSKEKVSIIIPAYNSERTIEKSVKSLLLQTYKDIEVIVVDDCSDDATPHIVGDLALKDTRVKLIRHNTNKGAYGARNTGIKASSGNYIAFQDADDFSVPYRIEVQLIPLCLGRALMSMGRIARSSRPQEEFDIAHPDKMMELIYHDFTEEQEQEGQKSTLQKVGYITTMLKKSIFEELGLFWESRFGADAEFVERVLFHHAGILWPEGVFAQNQLSRISEIDNVFKRIDKILMICLVGGEQNLSLRYKQAERLQFQALYRKRLQGFLDYDYPKLDATS